MSGLPAAPDSAPGPAERFEIFPTPVWQVPAPAMLRFHEEIKSLLRSLWDQGYFQAHGLVNFNKDLLDNLCLVAHV